MKFLRKIYEVLGKEDMARDDFSHLILIREYQALEHMDKLQFSLDLGEILKTTNFVNSPPSFIFSLLQLTAYVKPPYADNLLYNTFLNQVLIKKEFNQLNLHTLLMNVLCDYNPKENIYEKIKLEARTLGDVDYIITAIKRIGNDNPKHSIALIQYYLDYANESNKRRVINALTTVFRKNSLKALFNFVVSVRRNQQPLISEHPNFEILQGIISNVLTNIKNHSGETGKILLAEAVWEKKGALEASNLLKICRLLIKINYNEESSVDYLEALHNLHSKSGVRPWLFMPRSHTNRFIRDNNNSYLLIDSNSTMETLEIKEHPAVIELLINAGNIIYPEFDFGQSNIQAYA